MLLLVDDEQTEALELHVLGQQGMGPDDDVETTLGEIALDVLRLLGRDEARELTDAHRKPGEALLQGAKMLPREQRGRDEDGGLRARQGAEEGGATRSRGLADAV